MVPAPIRLRGNARVGLVIGAAMLGPVLPCVGLFQLFGERSLVGVLAGSFAAVLTVLAPIPFWQAARVSQQRLELELGRLRVADHKHSVDVGVDELEGFHPLAVGERWVMLTFKVRGELHMEDTRFFDAAGVAALVAAVRAARPDLAEAPAKAAAGPAA